MRRTFPTMTAFAALALASAADASGGQPDPVEKADPAPHPLPADQQAPAEPKADPQPAPAGNAPGADPSPPINAAEAAAGKAADKAAKPSKATKASKGEPAEGGEVKPDNMLDMVWVQPGHDVMAIGTLFRIRAFEGEGLRGAGRARYASKGEIKAAIEAGHDVPELSGL